MPSPTPQALAERAIRKVADSLQRGDRREAVRLYLQMLAHENALPEAAEPDWVINAIGKETTGELVSAMASFPCFACQRGIEPCGACGQSGMIAAEKVCVACMGLGLARCDFCNGAGLATYNLLPLQFRPAVARRRAARAVAALEKLVAALNADTPLTGDDLELIHAINRPLGAMENAILIARALAREGFRSEQWVGQIADSCFESAAHAEEPLRQVLRRLAAQQSQRAADAGAVAADDAIAKAEFLEQLAADSPIRRGTPLYHPVLMPTSAAPAETPGASNDSTPPPAQA